MYLMKIAESRRGCTAAAVQKDKKDIHTLAGGQKNIPSVSTPFLPARPAICLYARVSITRPPNIGDLTMTRRAGRLTPEDRVDVATSIFTKPWRNAPSTMSLSSKVKPEK